MGPDWIHTNTLMEHLKISLDLSLLPTGQVHTNDIGPNGEGNDMYEERFFLSSLMFMIISTCWNVPLRQKTKHLTMKAIDNLNFLLR